MIRKIENRAKTEGFAFEIYEHRSDSTLLKFESNDLKGIKGNTEFGRALRVIKDGRIGFSTTTDQRDAGGLIDRALHSSKFGSSALFTFPPKGKMPDVNSYSEETRNLGVEKLESTAREIIDSILETEPSATINIDIGTEQSERTILNSSGLDQKTAQSEFFISLSVQLIKGNDILEFDDLASSVDSGINYKDMALRAAEKLRFSRSSAKPASRKIPVIFTPEGSLTIILPLLMGLNAENVAKKTSPLNVSRIGEGIFDRSITINDSGVIANSPRSSIMDDEGTAKGETKLIEKGVLKNFFNDLQSAEALSMKPTGNGLKSSPVMGGFSINSYPSPSPNSLIIQGGDCTVSELLGQSREALIVDSVLGLGQGNIIAGDFSNNVLLGFLVRGGEIAGRVKNTMIFGNIYGILRAKTLLSRERLWAHGFMLAPWIFTDGLSVTF